MTQILLLLCAGLLLPLAVLGDEEKPKGEVANPGGTAIKAEKILTVTKGVIDHGVILVKDGKIEAVGPRRPSPLGPLKILARIDMFIPRT